MLHWIRAFASMALLAALVALSPVAPQAAAIAAGMFWFFAALSALALLTGAFGRGRNGLYCSERAVTLTALAGAAVFAALSSAGDPAPDWVSTLVAPAG